MRIDVPITGHKVNSNFQIVIPRIIRQAMGIKAGDIVEWSRIDVVKGEVSCSIRVEKKEPQQKFEG